MFGTVWSRPHSAACLSTRRRVRRFIYKLRGSQTPHARAVSGLMSGIEGQSKLPPGAERDGPTRFCPLSCALPNYITFTEEHRYANSAQKVTLNDAAPQSCPRDAMLFKPVEYVIHGK